MHFVYVLKSISYKRYYIGSTEDLENRLSYHNSGRFKSTKAYKAWDIITKSEAIKREKQIKSYKGGNAFKRLIGSKSF